MDQGALVVRISVLAIALTMSQVVRAEATGDAPPRPSLAPSVTSIGDRGDATTPKDASLASDLAAGPASAQGGAAHPRAIAAGGNTACTILENGTVRCWGDDSDGQLGDGDDRRSRLPVAVHDLDRVVALDLGSWHACALLEDGTMRCWGDNADGQLGDGGMQDSPVPVAVRDVAGVVAIAAGRTHTCALLEDGTVLCWGANSDGQLGGGSTGGVSPVPVAVADLAGVVGIRAGPYDACALHDDATVSCWGRVPGDPDPVPVPRPSGGFVTGYPGGFEPGLPRVLAGVDGVIDLVLGEHHACTLDEEGAVHCWGRGSEGQLGDGQEESRAEPTGVHGLSGVTSLTAGWGHTCALVEDATVWCWGGNSSGALGDGSQEDRAIPVAVQGLGRVVALTAGSSHTCAVTDDGAVSCWGYNPVRALGSCRDDWCLVPVMISGPTKPAPED